MRRCVGTAVLAIRASGDEQFERIEWNLARVHGRTRRLIFVLRLPVALISQPWNVSSADATSSFDESDVRSDIFVKY